MVFHSSLVVVVIWFFLVLDDGDLLDVRRWQSHPVGIIELMV